MSGAQTSTFSNAQSNVLFDPLAVQKAQGVQNQLLQQQQTISAENMAQVGQAAAGLLSAYPDEASRAAAYPSVVGLLQSQGFAKNAPAQYPGEGTLRAIVNASIPAKDLYSSGALLTPAQQAALGNTGTVTSTPTTGATAQPATGGFGAQLAQSESSGQPGVINKQGYTGLYQFGKQRLAQLGYYTPAPGEDMGDNTTWAGKVSVPGFNVTDQQSFAANPAAQQAVFNTHLGNIDQAIAATPGAARFDPNGLRAVAHLGGIEGMQKFVASGGTYSPGDANGTTLAAYYNKFSGAPQTTAAAQPAAAPAGGGGTQPPAPTQFAGPGAPPGSTAAPAPAPDTPWDLPGAPAPDLPPPATPTAAGAPAATPGQPQPGAPPGPAAQPPAPAAAPASTSSLPDASKIPTGRNSVAWQQAQQLIDQGNRLMIVSGSNPGMRAQAQAMIQRGTQQQQLDNMVPAQQDGRPGNLNTTTGQFTPYAPLPSPRFSQPTIDPSTGKPAIAAVSGSGTQYFPIPVSPAQGDYENMKTAYSGDVSTIKDVSAAGRSAQSSALQLNELADVIKNVQSGGALPEFRAKVAALMEANGAKPETIEAYTGMKSGSDAQVLQKLAVATIGASAKADLGSNVGVESLNLYANANPGMDKLQDANQRVTNMIRVARAQIDSYSLGAQQHFNQNQSTMLHTPGGQVPDYHPLSEYNQQWQAQNNPQIGAAAIGILNGDGFDKWAARAAPAEALNAVRLAARIDPNVQIPVKGGGFKSAQEVLSHGAAQ